MGEKKEREKGEVEEEGCRIWKGVEIEEVANLGQADEGCCKP